MVHYRSGSLQASLLIVIWPILALYSGCINYLKGHQLVKILVVISASFREEYPTGCASFGLDDWGCTVTHWIHTVNFSHNNIMQSPSPKGIMSATPAKPTWCRKSVRNFSREKAVFTMDFWYTWKKMWVSVNKCNDLCLARWWYRVMKTLMLQFSQRHYLCDKCQTLHDSTIHWAVAVRTTFSNLDHISRSQQLYFKVTVMSESKLQIVF